jgi:hypothetical protein
LVDVISQKDALQVQREENNGKAKGLVVFKSKFHLIHQNLKTSNDFGMIFG